MIARCIALAALAALAAACGDHGGRASHARTFSARVDNAWFPLRPGTKLVYLGVKDGQPSRDVVRISGRTKTIAGAPCVVVSDRLYVRGRLAERTSDWYTQDDGGTVWYYGEDTAELGRTGRVTSTEGSWQAGRDGAKPGIFMPAHPAVGEAHRQEYYRGHAEDRFQVLSVTARVRVAAAASDRALLTKETTPLEPDVVDHKYYVRGIGAVLEQTIRGGNERNVLVSFSRG